MRILTIAVAAIVGLPGCAPLTVSSHLERTANFAQYVTYDWGPRDDFPVGDPRLDNNAIYVDYLQGTIEKQLAAKGFVRAIGDEPDLFVHYHANVSQRVEVSQNHYGDATNYDAYEPRVTELELGTIVVDLIDAKTSRLVWRGWSQRSIAGVIDDQSRLEKMTAEGVMKMMATLPPAGLGDLRLRP
jgi:hypothetical protein